MKTPFLAAHGYDPGPSQRPYTAGALAGIVATIPAVVVLCVFGSLGVEAWILGLSRAETVGAGIVAMAIAGAVYARIFGRAANWPKGGWLFGMAFGFGLWAAGAILVLPIVSGGVSPAGVPALGVALSLLTWGLSVGVLVPYIHRPLDQDLESASRSAEVGPNAASGRRLSDLLERGRL